MIIYEIERLSDDYDGRNDWKGTGEFYLSLDKAQEALQKRHQELADAINRNLPEGRKGDLVTAQELTDSAESFKQSTRWGGVEEVPMSRFEYVLGRIEEHEVIE